MKQTRNVAALLLFLIGAGSLYGQSYVTVSLGHADTVNQMAMHPSEPLAVSAGDDGGLLLWDLQIEGLRQHFQIASAPLTRVAHHPVRNQVALFARDSLTRGRVIVYDWEEQRTLFERNVEGVPQLLAYSPSGAFIVVATNDFDSLSFFSSQTGDVLPYLTEGFGAVSFVQMAPGERYVLTYVPTRGELIYWELQTGREQQVAETVRRLRQLTLIDPENRRLLAGYTDEELIVIDNLTGSEMTSISLSGIHDIAYSESRNTLYVLSRQSGDSVVRAYRYINGRLRPTRYLGNRIDPEATTITAVEQFPTHELISGSDTGTVTLYAETTGTPAIIGSVDYIRADDVAFVGDQLIVTTGNQLVSFETDLFTEGDEHAGGSVEMSFLESSTTIMPELRRIQSVPDGDSLLVWGSPMPGTVWRVDPRTGDAQVIYERENAGAITLVRPHSDGLLVARRDGLVEFIATDEAMSFTYQGNVAQDAVWDPDIGLVIAHTAGSVFDSSIVVVDPSTEETVPVQTEAFLTRALVLSDERNHVYALSLTGDQGNAVAEIIRYTGRGLSRATRIYRGERGVTAGDMSWDEETQTLFTTLESGAVLAVTGEQAGQEAVSARKPQTVSAGSLVLASANSDGTVSLFWKETGRHLADIILFPDGWIVTAGRGYLVSDPDLEQYLRSIPLGTTRTPGSLSELELNLPLILRPDF